MSTGRLHQRQADEVSEGNLGVVTSGGELLVQFPATGIKVGHSQLPKARRRRNGEALGHIADQPGCRSLDERGVLRGSARTAARRRHLGSRGLRAGLRRHWCWRRGFSHHAALEQLAPLGGHRRGISQELLVERLREARVSGFEDIGIHGTLPERTAGIQSR